jgi:hypothetical protein
VPNGSLEAVTSLPPLTQADHSVSIAYVKEHDPTQLIEGKSDVARLQMTRNALGLIGVNEQAATTLFRVLAAGNSRRADRTALPRACHACVHLQCC